MFGVRRIRAAAWIPVAALLAAALVSAPALAGGESKDPFTHFGELTKDSEHLTGFFDIYTKRDKVYLEIPLDRLGEPILFISSLSRGIGDFGLLGGMPTTIFDGLMVKFERRGDKIHFIQLNHKFRAPEGTSEGRAVNLSFGNSVLASLKIESERKEGDEVGVVPEPPEEKKEEKEEEEEDTEGESDDEMTEDEGTEDTSPEDLAEAAPEEPEKEDEEEEEKPVVSLVVEFTPVLLSDLTNIGQAMNEGVFFTRKLGGQYSLDKDRTAMGSIKVFPKNAEFDTDLVFSTRKDPFLPSVIDSRYITVGMHHSFSELPREPMQPRFADARMGYWLTVYKDFTRTDEKEWFVRYINRWRLEKKNPNQKMSEPVKPIVFYVENTVPKEYRQHIKEGIELWQRAFEKAGFKKAIIAKDHPDDPEWSAEDVRYSTIRWITTHRPSFGAVGPSRTDPRTGEILDADILMDAQMFQGMQAQWQRMVSPDKTMSFGTDPFELALDADRVAFEEALAKGGPSFACRLCAAPQSLALSTAFASIALTARGDLRPGDPMPPEYMAQAIRWVTAHEVGHSIGLMHNFKSSMAVPYEKLNDKSYAQTYGLYGSVMEYPVVNISEDARSQGFYYSPAVGTWDEWMIRYGYTEFKGAKKPEDETAELMAIAAQSSDPKNAFGSGLNAYPIGAVDPYVNVYDLGDDPLQFAMDRSAHIRSLYAGLEDRIVGKGDAYDNLTQSFSILLFNYYRSLRHVARYVGGMETNRGHRGDPGATEPPMVMLSPAKQREAVEFLAGSLFSQEAFLVPVGFAENLEPNRWTHWGINLFHGGREDFPFHTRVLAMQRPIIGRITHPITMNRILDAELYQESPFTLVELFDTMGGAIWDEVKSAGTVTAIPTIRRGAQRLWLDQLIQIAFIPQPGTPDDARAVARMYLADLRDDLGKSLVHAASMDGYTKAHLLDCQARIETAIEAGYQLEVMSGK